jgi:citrate lyase subunit beta / citryl-CoA lyase
MSAQKRPAAVTRLRRSLHFVPGANQRMFDRAVGTAADALILDLEDAVTPERKEEARRTVSEWLGQADFRGKERMVRINPLDTPWGMDDIRATMAHPPDAYVVPKISTVDELHRLDAALCRLAAENGHAGSEVGLIPVSTETPLGALNVATFPGCCRVIGLSWGAEDLSAALGASHNRHPDGRYLDVYRYCRVQTLLAAAAGDVQPIDTVFVDLRDPDGLAAESREAALMGYTGKITIHPDQIDIVNAAFTPDAEAVDAARRLIAAMEEAEQQGRMAIQFEGRMVDVPHLNRARRLLERARQIQERP